MKEIKRILLAIFLSNSMIFSSGIPVVDTAANQQMATQNAKQIAEWTKEASRWQETVAHYQKQLQAYADQLLSQTGIKDSISTLGDFRQIYNDFGRAYENIQDFNNKVLEDPQSFITDKIGETYKKYTLFDRCEKIESTQIKTACMVDMITYVAQEQSIQNHQKNLNEVSKTIAELDTKLRNSKDIKESQDIANALASESLKIQMIQASIEADNKIFELKRREKEEQLEQMLSQRINNFEYVPIPIQKGQ